MVPAKAERAKLDRHQVVAAAIAWSDAEGLDGLSMRALANRLGVVPMALYKHVADKEDLIGAMVDAVVEEYADPDVQGPWKDRVKARIDVARRAVHRHPWLCDAIVSRNRRTEAVMAHLDAVAGDFLGGGVSPDLTHYGMHALGTRVWGFSAEAFEDPDAPTPDDASNPDVLAYFTEKYPNVVTIALDAAARSPAGTCDHESEFDFTVDLLLDAIDRLHEQGWQSRPLSG